MNMKNHNFLSVPVNTILEVKKLKKKIKKSTVTPSNHRDIGLPETAFDMINRYGTYEIQATAETENQYPAIAQGFNKKQIETDRDTDIDGKKKPI